MIVVVTLVLLGLVHAVGTECGNLANVEALVGADALVLEVVLVAVIVAAQVDIATVRELADGLADGLAGRGHIVHVQFDLRIGSEDKLGNGQSDGGSVAHIGEVEWDVRDYLILLWDEKEERKLIRDGKMMKLNEEVEALNKCIHNFIHGTYLLVHPPTRHGRNAPGEGCCECGCLG